MIITVQAGEDQYRLVSGEHEGELVDYGEVARLEINGRQFAALVDIDEQGELVCLLGDDYVYELIPCESEIEDVEFVAGDAEDEEEVTLEETEA